MSVNSGQENEANLALITQLGGGAQNLHVNVHEIEMPALAHFFENTE